MSSSYCTVVECSPLLSSERGYSDGSVIKSTSVSFYVANDGGRVLRQRLLVPVGVGTVPYSDSSVVAVNATVKLLNCFIRLKNGSTAQSIPFSIYRYGSAGSKYYYNRTIHLDANESVVVEIGKIDGVDLFADGTYNNVYVGTLPPFDVDLFEFYCNVVVDD